MMLLDGLAALIIGFAAGMAAMALIYGERNHRSMQADFARWRGWANGEPQCPANDATDAPTRARRAGW